MSMTLDDNNAKLDNLEKVIRAANERRRKLIEKSKLIAYDTISNLYSLEGQELIDRVSEEHSLIEKFIAKGMSFEQISELTDDADNSTNSDDDALEGQHSFFEGNHHSYR